jgi:(2Fe-2S) ferredoxin
MNQYSFFLFIYVVATTGCLGFCQEEPLVSVQRLGHPRLVYSRVQPEMVSEIIDGLVKGQLTARHLLDKVYADDMLVTGERHRLAENDGECGLQEIPFYKLQVKIATRNCGYIDPGSIAEYIARAGYLTLTRALTMKPEEVIAGARKPPRTWPRLR